MSSTLAIRIPPTVMVGRVSFMSGTTKKDTFVLSTVELIVLESSWSINGVAPSVQCRSEDCQVFLFFEEQVKVVTDPVEEMNGKSSAAGQVCTRGKMGAIFLQTEAVL